MAERCVQFVRSMGLDTVSPSLLSVMHIFVVKYHDFRNLVYHLWPANRLNQHPSLLKTITILPMKLGLQINLRRIFVYEFLPLGSVPCATIEVCLTEAPYGFLKKNVETHISQLVRGLQNVSKGYPIPNSLEFVFGGY